MRKIAFIIFILVVLLVACSPKTPPTVEQIGIEITQPKVILPGGDAMSGMDSTLSGYMTIKNTSASADRLKNVTVDFASAGLYKTQMEGDIIKMNAVTGIDIPAGETVELKPDGFHIMFMNMSTVRIVKIGEKVNVVLEFEKAGRITVLVAVTDK